MKETGAQNNEVQETMRGAKTKQRHTLQYTHMKIQEHLLLDVDKKFNQASIGPVNRQSNAEKVSSTASEHSRKSFIVYTVIIAVLYVILQSAEYINSMHCERCGVHNI